jgi:hypothetical protein
VGDINGNGLPNIACVTFGSDGVVYAFKSLATEPGYICGDANSDGIVNIGDIVYLVSYCYKGGPAPIPQTCVGDANNDDIVNIGDIVYLVSYCYKGGPVPDPDCCNPPWVSE